MCAADRGTNSCPEIEVTTEMVEAGLEFVEIWGAEESLALPHVFVTRLYRRMALASREHSSLQAREPECPRPLATDA